MEVGVTMFLTDRTIAPDQLAAAAEERGFSSLWVPEHTHIPVSRRTPPPTGEDELDESYVRTLDPWVALATASSITTTLRLGTGVALVAQHDPIALAKQVATLDHLSGGRVVLGVGYGWNREEMEDHGVEYARRRAVVREHVLCMQALWRDEVASFDGEFVHLSPSRAEPKPVQQPRVRTLIGGAPGPLLFRHVAEYADGWMPIGGSGVAAALPALRTAAEAAGRDPSSLAVVPFGVVPSDEKLDYYRSTGLEEVVLRVPAGGRDDTLAALDRLARFLSRTSPAPPG